MHRFSLLSLDLRPVESILASAGCTRTGDFAGVCRGGSSSQSLSHPQKEMHSSPDQGAVGQRPLPTEGRVCSSRAVVPKTIVSKRLAQPAAIGASREPEAPSPRSEWVYPRAINDTAPVANSTPISCEGDNRSSSRKRAKTTVTSGYIDVTTVTTGSRPRWTARRKKMLPPMSRQPAAPALPRAPGSGRSCDRRLSAKTTSAAMEARRDARSGQCPAGAPALSIRIKKAPNVEPASRAWTTYRFFGRASGGDLRALGSMLKSPIATSPQAIPTKPIELGLSPTATPNSTGRPAVCIAVSGATTLICPRANASYSNASPPTPSNPPITPNEMARKPKTPSFNQGNATR